MTKFEEKLDATNLPEMARRLLPSSLSDDIQKRLVKEEHMEEIIQEAIEEINKGSVEKLEKLIEKRCRYF